MLLGFSTGAFVAKALILLVGMTIKIKMHPNLPQLNEAATPSILKITKPLFGY